MDNPVSDLPAEGKKSFWQLILSSRSRTLGFLAILIIIAAIPLTVIISQQQQTTNQHASTGCNDAREGLPTCRIYCTTGTCVHVEDATNASTGVVTPLYDCCTGTSPQCIPNSFPCGGSNTQSCCSGNCSSGICQAVTTDEVDGSCGDAATQYTLSQNSFSGNFCSSGIISSTPRFPVAGVPANWVCKGENGGQDSPTCTATKASAPTCTGTCNTTPLDSTKYSCAIDGTCGDYSYCCVSKSTTGTTTNGNCPVSSTADSRGYTYSCSTAHCLTDETHGTSSNTCSTGNCCWSAASTTVVNGKCDNTGPYQCDPGIPVSENLSSTEYTWHCQGNNDRTPATGCNYARNPAADIEACKERGGACTPEPAGAGTAVAACAPATSIQSPCPSTNGVANFCCSVAQTGTANCGTTAQFTCNPGNPVLSSEKETATQYIWDCQSGSTTAPGCTFDKSKMPSTTGEVCAAEGCQCGLSCPNAGGCGGQEVSDCGTGIACWCPKTGTTKGAINCNGICAASCINLSVSTNRTYNQISGTCPNALNPDGGNVSTTVCCALASTSTCGNGTVDSGETCDGNIQSCTTSSGYSGTQTCNITCNGWNTCTTTQKCGDGSCNGSETCSTCPSDCGSCNTAPTYYACSTSTGTCSVSSSATSYTSAASCNNACTVIPTYYACVSSTGTCSVSSSATSYTTLTSCTSACAANSVSGACGPLAKSFSSSDTTWPDSTWPNGLCSVGNSSPVSPTFPAAGASTAWSCQGSGGGTNASCTASRQLAGNMTLAFTLGLDGIGAAGDQLYTCASLASCTSTKSPRRSVSNPRDLQVFVYDIHNNLVVNKQSTTLTYGSSTGLFTGSLSVNLTPGSYTIKASSSGYLRKLVPGIQNLIVGTNNISSANFNLTNGDIDGDNSLTIFDYRRLVNVLNSCPSALSSFPTIGSPNSFVSKDGGAYCNANPNDVKFADLDDNGYLDISDYNLFLREFKGQNGD